MTTTARFVPESKLPEVGTTIFSVMSALAAEKKAVNLGQGFPDFSCDPALPALVAQAMTDNYNQYPPMPGMPQLREQIAAKIKSIYGHAYDVNTEITVTAGATQGILTILLACVHTGDEVIVIEPAYDSYVSSIKLAGAVPVFVSMELGANGYTIPWEKVKASITGKTRLLMLNSPHNPTGSVLNVDDIAALSDIVRDTKVLIASDEVYEHMVFDGGRHESLSRYPELAERSFIISSFGKTYHVTGWKVGYVTAPAALMAEFRKVHQYNVFTVNTPMQVGLAQYMGKPAPYLELSDFYQKKRDLFRAGLVNSRLRLLPCAGTYFQSVDYSAVSDKTELEFARWLTTEIGVAAIPVSAFYQQGKESGIVRFCFAKQDATLQDALQRLQSI
ncbi:pyridoxal phosphate-dependent aminotransferase [Undibacterium sp. Di27W]|uniref:pyridoxal phosphate-dependent aminotransferase n=1 Tax=Undibacterium sp. Di27W TaxID=3413036 RepID=UPI003BF19705